MNWKLAFVAVSSAIVLWGTNVLAAPKMTSFDPKIHGFHFSNSFSNNFAPALNIQTKGLCGGMASSALDFFFYKRPIPNQTYRPANGTPLQRSLYSRQVDAITADLAKWAELAINPNGIRNKEFFNWGLQAGSGGRITELRSFIDAGKPVLIGLQPVDNSMPHYVLAIGYDLGRYTGNLGAYKEDFKIFVYNSNVPDRVTTLSADPTRDRYVLEYDGEWRTYFVSKNYSLKPPPVINNPVYPKDGTVRELLLTFSTGNDDLRGGNDNVNLTVTHNMGGRVGQFSFNNINMGGRWLDNYDETVSVPLPIPVPISALQQLTISTTFGGGVAGDNWDMAKVVVRGIGGGYDEVLRRAGFFRFTGSARSMTVPITAPAPIPAGRVNRLFVRIATGKDDLRGGKDNLDITVNLPSSMQTFANVNGSGQWKADSIHEEILVLNQPVDPQDVRSILLSTTSQEGTGSDDWDMKSIEVNVQGGPQVNLPVFNHGYNRFTPRYRHLTVQRPR